MAIASGQASALSVVSESVDAITPEQIREWSDLLGLQREPVNPFLAPTWVLAWYRTWVEPAERVLLFVRARSSGQLLGVAPLYVQRLGVGKVGASRLMPVGAGIGPNPFELPGLLTTPDSPRDITRAVVAECLARDVDWSEISLAPWQGWFEPEWVSAAENPVTFSDYQRPRACVVLPLAATWEQTRSGLKRNLKESVRRSRNRLTKDGRSWEVVHHMEAIDTAVVERFLGLHAQRSRTERTNVHHPDAYADEASRSLMLTTIPTLAHEGLSSVFELVIEGKVVASQLALHAPGCSYVHSSGFDQREWALGPITLLQSELVRHAVDRGDRIVNFSPGPNVSKLRWSEELYVAHEFAFGSGPRSLQVRYSAHQSLRALRANASAIAFVRRSRGDRQVAAAGKDG